MKKRAFTLIELIICLAIISIIYSVVSLRLTGLREVAKREELESFINDYEYAKSKAISTGMDSKLLITRSSYRIQNGSYEIKRDFKYLVCDSASPLIEISPLGYIYCKDHNYNIVFLDKDQSERRKILVISIIGGYIRIE